MLESFRNNGDIYTFFCGKINFILIMGSWWTLPVLVFVIFLKCVKTLAWKIRPGTQMIAYFCYIKILRLILIAIPRRHHRIYIVFFLERLSSSFFFWYITKLGTPAQKNGIYFIFFSLKIPTAAAQCSHFFNSKWKRKFSWKYFGCTEWKLTLKT